MTRARRHRVHDIAPADRFEHLRSNPAFWACLLDDLNAQMEHGGHAPEVMAAYVHLGIGARGLLAAARQVEADNAMEAEAS